ncbi:MAG: ABC transporter permease [Planctomycetaceae bacterium]
MGRYLIRRSLFMILVLWIISIVTFLIFVKLPPGDPARRLAGKGATPQILAQVRHNVGLDKPIWVQYGRFAEGLIPLPGLWLNPQVYYSWSNRVEVRAEIRDRFPVTATLTLGATVLWLLIGIPIGILSAIRRRSWADRGSMLFALFGVSMPTFWLGMLLIYFFYYKLRWAPPTGINIGQSLVGAVLDGKFLLAWITLAVTSAAYYTRIVRGNMLEVMSEDYIRTARAKGLPERTVTYKHALRASLTPVVTMLGLDVATLLGGAVITERVFSLPGLGVYALDSLALTDFPAVMGVTIVAAIFIVVANLVVDIMYAALDPRVRFT